MSHSIDKQGIADALLKGMINSGAVQGVNLEADVEVTPGKIDTRHLEDGIRKATEKAAKNMGPINVPVDVDQNLSRSDQKKIEKILENINKTAFNKNDYRSRKSGTINQGWFDNAVNELKQLETTLETLDLDKLQRVAELYSQINGIVSGKYKPKSKIDTTGIDLSFLNKLSSGRIRGRVEDLVGGYVPRSSGRSTGSFARSVDLSSYKTEREAIDTLRQAVEGVTRAVREKTAAFENERNSVGKYVEDEVKALQNLQEKAGKGISVNMVPVQVSTPQTQQTRSSSTQRVATTDGKYPWGDSLGARNIAEYIIKQGDISHFVKELEKVNDDGSFNPTATLNALKEFKEKIGILSESNSLDEFYETALKMKAFNAVLDKVKQTGSDGSLSGYVLNTNFITGNNKYKGNAESSKLKELIANEISSVEAAKAATEQAQAEVNVSVQKSKEANESAQDGLSAFANVSKGFIQLIQEVLYKIEEIRQGVNSASTGGKQYATLDDYYDDHPNEAPVHRGSQFSNETLSSIEQATLDIAGYAEAIKDVITAKKEEAAAIKQTIAQTTEEAAASEELEAVKEKQAGLLSSMLSAIREEREKAQAKYADYPLDTREGAFGELYFADERPGLIAKDWVKGMASRATAAIKERISGAVKAFIAEFTPALSQKGGVGSNTAASISIPNVDFKNAIEATTKAFASDGEINASAGNLLEVLTKLETKLNKEIPAAVDVKNKAFENELSIVTGYLKKENEALDTLGDNVAGLLYGDKASDSRQDFLEEELTGLETLKNVLSLDIPNAIDTKNTAFKEERDKVVEWVDDEIEALRKLGDAAKGVTPPQSPSRQQGGGTAPQGGGQNGGSPPVLPSGRRGNNWNLPRYTSVFDKIDFNAIDDESGNLSQQVIDILTRLLSNATSGLYNYYDKSRQIATGKFNLNQLSGYYRNALPIRDVIDNLGDISYFANLPKEGGGFVNEALHDVYEAFINEEKAVVNTTAKVLEQGNLISDISSILYDGSKTLIERMNELARYAMDNAGAIHSAINKTESYDDAKSALRYLGKNMTKHYGNNALLEAGLLSNEKKASLPGENNEWKYYHNKIQPLLNDINSLPDDLRKRLQSFKNAEEHIINDVVKDIVEAAQQRAADLSANALTNNSPTAKANRAINRLSSQQKENEYQTLKLFQENGMLYGVKNVDKLSDAEVNKLLDDQAAKLKDLKDKRDEEFSTIKAVSKEISSENGLLKQQWDYYINIFKTARAYAEQRLKEAGASIENNPFKKDVNNLYDAFYRAENFTQKKNTVGIVGSEEAALQEAIQNYEELRKKLEAVAEEGNDASKALNWLDEQQKKASDKLRNKWTDARDRRYGEYLNEGESKGTYKTRDDILAGLQRYATREGAKGFNLFDGKAVGNIQKYRAEIENTDGTIEKLNLTLNKTTGELFSVSMGTKQSTSFFEAFGEGLKRRAIGMAQYVMTFASLRSAMAWIKQGINQIREFDAAFVELSRISNDSASALEEFKRQSFELADTVGGTATQITNAAAQWEHLGYNIKDATELAKTSAVYTNIADGMSSASEATEDLVSIMKAYKIPASEAMDVTDALIAVSNNYAVTAADIGNALKRSASAMSVANNTFEQNVALATAMAEVTQNAEKSGSALQVLSLRIRGAKTELQEMGEDTDDMASSTSKLRAQVKGLTKGFDIMKDDKTFKQTYEIMEGIAKVWGDLDDISRASLLETLAG